MAEQEGSIREMINAKHDEIDRRLDKLEDNDRRHEEDIKQLYGHQEGTKAYVAQILNKIESLETKLFNLLAGNQNLQAQEREAERQERSSSTNGWIDLTKYVIGGTIIAVVAYIMGGK